MEKKEQEIVIDWKYLLKSLLKRAWIIIFAGVIFGASALVYTAGFVTPKYASSVMLYVNNKSFQLGGSVSISAADLSASQSLIDTYIGILKTRTTLEEVADKSGLGYGYGQLLVENALAVAKDNSCAFITLEVRISNSPAISLYEKCGFEKVRA